MYSSHRIDSVTCLRFSSRCTAAQSGSACRRWPCWVPDRLRAGKQPRLQRSVGHARRATASSAPPPRTAADRQPHRRWGRPHPPGNLAARTSRPTSTEAHRAHGASRSSLLGIRSPPSQKPKGADRKRASRAPRHPGRHHPGMVGEIISEWWATSNRNGGRDHSGMVGDIERNQQTSAPTFALAALLSFRRRRSSCARFLLPPLDHLSRRGASPSRYPCDCDQIFRWPISAN